MIYKLDIIDFDNTPVSYLPDITFPKSIKFTKGNNIIIGPNGSGKSTLFKLLRYATLCDNNWNSKLTYKELSKLTDIYKLDSNIFNGYKVIADYRYATFNLRPVTEMHDDDLLEDFTNFGLAFSKYNSSYGQSIMSSLTVLMNKLTEINIKLDYSRLIDDYSELLNRINSDIRIQRNGDRITVLMDEPDRNLDIDNLIQVFNIINYDRPDVQLIVSLHNPLLIYKLSKNKSINFIELEKGYLDKITKFVDDKICFSTVQDV